MKCQSKQKSTFFITVYISTFSLLIILLTYYAFDRVGIGWDSRMEVDTFSLIKNLDTNRSLQEAYDLIPWLLEFYGIAHHQLAELTLNYFTTDSKYIGDNAETYKFQIIINLIYFLVALWISAFVVLRITNSKILFILYSFFITFNTPLFGHLLVNFKDFPVSTGMAVYSSALILLWITEKGKIYRTLVILLLGIGIFMSVGSRPATLILIFFITLSYISLLALTSMRKAYLTNRNFYGTIIGNIAGFMAIYLTQPFAKIDFFNWVIDSANSSQKFPYESTIRMFGIDYSTLDLPKHYIISWLFIQMTEFVILFAITIVFIVITLLLKSKSLNGLHYKLVYIAPFIIQGFVIPIILIIQKSILYDGNRHILFIYMPLVATFFIVSHHFTSQFLKLKSLFNIIILIMIALGVHKTIAWYPLNYAYTNEKLAMREKVRNWDMDYWGVSAREAIQRLEKMQNEIPIVILPTNEVGIPYGTTPLEQIGKGESFYLYIFYRWDYTLEDYGCNKIFNVERNKIKLGEAGLCIN